MAEHVVNLSDAQEKAMEYACASVQDWIEIAATNRARLAAEEICKLYTDYKFANNEPINVSTRDEMILAAFDEGIVQTAVQSNTDDTASEE